MSSSKIPEPPRPPGITKVSFSQNPPAPPGPPGGPPGPPPPPGPVRQSLPDKQDKNPSEITPDQEQERQSLLSKNIPSKSIGVHAYPVSPGPPDREIPKSPEWNKTPGKIKTSEWNKTPKWNKMPE